METIKEAKEHLQLNAQKGSECPCCHQFVKVYKRKLSSVMARMLIRLHMLGPGHHHVLQIVTGISDTGTNDFSKLRYWGMIEERKNDDKDKRTSSYWKITPSGSQFVNKWGEVPMYAFIYNKRCLRMSIDERTNIIKALGSKWSYKELMRAV